MSLVTPKMSEIVIKQWKYKLEAYIGALVSLMMVQIIGILLGFGFWEIFGTGTAFADIRVFYYSGDVINALTMIWAFMTALLITTKAYRYSDFPFVTNRLSSHISNAFYLFSMSIVGAACALFASFFLKVFMYFFFKLDKTPGLEILFLEKIAFTEYIAEFIALVFYLLLFSALGYFFGMLYQVSKAVLFAVIFFFFGGLFLLGIQAETLFQFYGKEHSLILFILKVFITVLMIFSISALISNKLEVR